MNIRKRFFYKTQKHIVSPARSVGQSHQYDYPYVFIEDSTFFFYYHLPFQYAFPGFHQNLIDKHAFLSFSFEIPTCRRLSTFKVSPPGIPENFPESLWSRAPTGHLIQNAGPRQPVLGTHTQVRLARADPGWRRLCSAAAF